MHARTFCFKRFSLWWFAGLWALFCGCSAPVEFSDGVELVLNSDQLEATSTFELRFQHPPNVSSQTGRAAAGSPLRIVPDLPGQFVWLSERSGVFTPTQAMRLGTAYHFSLVPGVAPGARLQRIIRTPAFAIITAEHDSQRNGSLRSEPQIDLQFNAAVRARELAPFLEFRDQAGRRVAAGVRQNPVAQLFSWRERFAASQRPSAALALAQTKADSPGPAQVNNSILVSPLRPLPVGIGWKLVVGRHAPAAEDDLRLPSEFILPLGDVQPFTVWAATARSGLHSGNRIEIDFSRGLGPELTPTNVLSWINTEPLVEDLSATVAERQIVLRGEFQVGRPYVIQVRPSLPSDEPSLSLAQVFKTNITFAPLPPRLYFPAFDGDQLATGACTFELLAVNAQSIDLRAKRLDRHTLIHALRAYGRYFRAWNERDDQEEPYCEVDFDVLAGRTIYERRLVPGHQRERSQRLELSWDEIVGPGRRGAIFLTAQQELGSNAHRKRQGTQALIQLTDLGLAWKYTAKQALVFVFSYRTGEPIAHAMIQLLSDDNEVLAETRSDDQGLAELAVPSRAHWLLAEQGEDLHALRFDGERVPLYGFRFSLVEDEDPVYPPRVLMFTDRPVYRPGESVQLKAIVRPVTLEGLAPPASSSVKLRWFNSRQEVFSETNVLLSALGSLAQTLPLPSGMRGTFRVELGMSGQSFTHEFQVQDFQPNAFEIQLEAKPVYGVDEKIELPISARYYFGKPIAGGHLRWRIEAGDRGFAPAGFERFQFCGSALSSDPSLDTSSVTLRGESELSAGYRLAPAIPLNRLLPQPRECQLSIELTDANQQTLGRSMGFLRHSSDFYLGLRRPAQVTRVGEEIPLELIGVRADNVPQETAVDATITVQRVEWQTMRVLEAGRSIGYRSLAIVTNLFSAPARTQLVEAGEQGWRVQSGAPVKFVPGEAGLYRVEARAVDSAGHEVATALMVHVAGPDQIAWDYRNPVRIEMVPDRKKYKPGDTATILLKTPIEGKAIVTVERERVMRSFVTELGGSAPAIRVPILADDAPNIFVSVFLVRGSAQSAKEVKVPEYRLGYCELGVINPLSRLQVAVRPGQAAYRPGDQAQVNVEVTDALSRPVSGAEVTLYAVDEGVLGLTEYLTPDPHAFFWEARPLAVRFGLSLNRLVPEDPSARAFGNKGYLVGGGGQERLRTKFLSTAFWSADLLTDGQGKVAASFVAPDNLTRYRVIAVVQTAGNQFGNGESRIELRKPLLVEPALPLFATVGDRLLARALLHNTTDLPGEIQVTLELDDKARATNSSSLRRQLSLPAKGSAHVDFPIQLVAAGAARWIWKAQTLSESGSALSDTNAFRDAVESKLTVTHAAPLLREVHLGRAQKRDEDLLGPVNPQLLEGDGTIVVRLSNTRLSSLEEAVSRLLHYPYGCVEQTTSSLLPWLIVRRCPALAAGLGTNLLSSRAAIEAGLARLAMMQTESGGLGYWPGNREPMFWGSAYAGLALVLAQRDGFLGTRPSLDALLRYLSEQLRSSSDARNGWLGSDEALALYTLALAGRAETGYQEKLFQRRHQLSVEDRALLALAVAESGGPSSMSGELLDIPSQGTATGEPARFGGTARALAIPLLAWSRCRPTHPAVDRAVAELIGSAKQAHWVTTQGNAWALLALAEYAMRVEAATLEAKGTLRFGDKHVSFALSPKPQFFECTFTNFHPNGATTLVLENSLEHPVFTQVTVEARSRVNEQPRQDRGFSLLRRYTKLDDANAELGLEDLHVGDRVLVTLTLLAPQPASYVAIDDALPAILEPLHPEFKSRSTVGSTPDPIDWFSDYRELRAERALFFRNYLPAGQHVIRYLARVRAAGDVIAPSAKVEAMYQPERLSITETRRIAARPWP